MMLAEATRSLSHLADSRSVINKAYLSESETLGKCAKRLPSTKEIERNANQLHEILTPEFIREAQDATLMQQIREMCEQLDTADVHDGVFDEILNSADVDTGDDGSISIDIRGELEKARLLDHEKLLELKAKLLDTVGSHHVDMDDRCITSDLADSFFL